MNRRQFLKFNLSTMALGAIGFPAVVSSSSPNSKLNIAVIGVGGRGGHNMGQMGG